MRDKRGCFTKGTMPPNGFKKGCTPFNKGIKIWWESPTKFKKGQNAGSKHPRWKGGNSRGYKTGYHSKEYKEWRMSVFLRDGFKCQCCEVVGVYLTAHHIKSFAHYPELRFEVDNGITLCEECHSKTDNYKGRGMKKKILL